MSSLIWAHKMRQMSWLQALILGVTPHHLFQVHWLATGDGGLPLIAGAYWIRARFDGHEVANLVFLES